MICLSILASSLVLFSGVSDSHKKLPPKPDGAKTIKVKTDDKISIRADVVLSKSTTKQFPRSGVVILVHGFEQTRKHLWDLQSKINSWGAASMVLDLRGFGDSGKPKKAKKKRNAPTLSPEEQKIAWHAEDIKAAVEYLKKKYKKKVDPSRIAIVGLDVGAAAAVRYAANDYNIRGVGILSAEIDVPGFSLNAEATKLSNRGLLLMVPKSSEEELNRMKEELPKSVDIYALASKGEGKGLGLFAGDRTLMMELRLWLRDLGTLAAGP